jgi:hypothetical protein
MAFNKNIRSLKVAAPPASELTKARNQILSSLRRFNNKFSIDARTDPEGWKRKKPLVEEITKKLGRYRKPGLSQKQLFNQTVIASCVRKDPDPVVVEGITADLVVTVTRLYRILGHPDFPRNYQYRISGGRVENWNQFIQCLERSMEITYKKRPRNEDPVKRQCAINAYLLITDFTTGVTPTKTRGGLYYAVADLIYQVNYPNPDDGNTDKLKHACDKFLDAVRLVGFDQAALNRDRW